MADIRFIKLYGKSVGGDLMSEIQYTSSTGYTGVLFDKSSLIVYDPKHILCFHTGSRKINTYEELVEFVDNYAEFEAKLVRLWEDRQCM